MNEGGRHSPGRGRIFFDMALVVISVLLGLALGDWRDAREKNEIARKVLAALNSEIAANRAAIESGVEAREKLIGEFREASLEFTRSGKYNYPADAENVEAARFSRAAYDSALMSQTMPRLSVETLLKLSALYSEQELYANMRLYYANAIVQTDLSDGARYLRLRSNLYAELVGEERKLLPLLDAAAQAVSGERLH